MDRDVASGDTGQDLAQRRQVEDVRQALAVGLDEDREGAIARGDREQVGRPLALLPERRPRARPASRQEQGSGRVLAEAAGEHRRRRKRPDDEVLDLVGLREEQRLDAIERGVALGQPDRDAVVRPDRLDLHPQSLADPRLEGQRPRLMDPAAERGQQAQSPVAQLVAEALDDDPLVGRQGARRLALVVQVGQQVGGRTLVEIVRLAQEGRGGGPALLAPGEVRLELADERTHRPAELDRPADRVALPERQLAGHAGGRCHGHPVAADLVDPPAARAEDDDVAVHPGAELVDHLLVELADPTAGRPGLARHEHAEQAAIRDRPAARDRHDARVAAALDRVGHPVPHDARLELGELVGRIGAGEHAEDALEDLTGQRLVGRRAGDDGEQLVHRPAIHDGHRDQLLGKDVERVARDRGRLDRALVHPAGDDRAFEQVAAVLREDHALRGRADLVPGAADPLEAPGDAGRALDLDDEVDRAHVDAELKAGRRDQGGQPAGLELLLDLEPLLAGDAPVVGADELLAGQLVEPLGEALGQAPAVGEHDRAVVAPDELEDRRVDRRPDARPEVASRGRPTWLVLGRQELADRRHVVDRHDDLELERLARARVDDGDLAIGAHPAQEAARSSRAAVAWRTARSAGSAAGRDRRRRPRRGRRSCPGRRSCCRRGRPAGLAAPRAARG